MKQIPLNEIPKVFNKPLCCIQINTKELEDNFKINFEYDLDDLDAYDGCCLEIAHHLFFLKKHLNYTDAPLTVYSEKLTPLSLKIFLDHFKMKIEDLEWVSPLVVTQKSI